MSLEIWNPEQLWRLLEHKGGGDSAFSIELLQNPLILAGLVGSWNEDDISSSPLQQGATIRPSSGQWNGNGNGVHSSGKYPMRRQTGFFPFFYPFWLTWQITGLQQVSWKTLSAPERWQRRKLEDARSLTNSCQPRVPTSRVFTGDNEMF